MAGDDVRFYITFYAIHLNDLAINFGNFSDHHKLLVEEYVNDGCSSEATSSATLTHKFIYSEHIKKIYFIEGTIHGTVTFAASSATAFICKYRVTVCKVHTDTTETELFTTGWVTVDDTLIYNSTYSVGEEMVYPFRIDAWENKKLDENERIYLKIESTCSDDANFSSCSDGVCSNLVVFHSNDATWEDIKIEIPFKL